MLDLRGIVPRFRPVPAILILVLIMKKKSGIHLVSIFFMTMLLLGAFAALTTNSVSAAQDGDYTYTQSGGVATITGYTGAGGDITIPSTLGGFPTRTIGSNAFNNVNGHLITSVIIPDSVTSIGISAFQSCTLMTSVTIGNGVTTIKLSAFQSCTALTSVTIPGSVTTIVQYAFYSCTELTSVTIPNSVTIIGDGAFQLCTKLTSVTIGNGVTSIGISAFQSCTSLTSVTYTPTSKVATIGGNAFWLCTSLTSVTIPNSVTSIGTYAFYSCAALTSVTIGNGVTSIGVGAFYSCTSLTSMTIPDSVTTIGDSAFQECNYLTSVTIGNGVTSIGNSAFYFCNRLTSVTIPNSVTSIGDSAFQSCTKLTSVTIPDSVTSIGDMAFVYCNALTAITVDSANVNYSNNVGDGILYDRDITTLIQYPVGNARTSFTIPTSVITIGDYSFSYGMKLTTVTIPANVTSIEMKAFSFCYSLTSINFHGLVAPTTVGADWIQYANAGVTGHAYYGSNFPKSTDVPNTFNGLTMGTTVAEDYTYTLTDGKATITAYTGAGGAITIPDHLPITSANDVVAIGAGAFDNAAGHTVSSIVSMPDTLTTIGTNAFRSCSLLTTIAIGNGVNSIGNYAFQSCTALTSVTIPDSVTYIGEYAFRSCTALTSVTIPGSVTSIKQGVFYSCSALTSVTIPGSVTSIQLGAFFYCTSLTSVTIPDNVTSIGDYAFQSCTSLTSVTIPDNVTSIGKNAFQSCTSLTSVTIPGSVTSIGDYTFQSCTSLTSVTIPGSVTSIGDYAFYSCTSLTSVTIPDSVISIGTRAFYSCTALTAITVDPDNVNYANNADDGVLYNKTITKLIQYPIGNERTSFTIPGSVTSIGDYAFAGTRLTSVTIPANVTSIGSNVFYSCSSLTSITFHGLVAPTSVAANWIQNVPVAVRGYAYSASNFPDTGSGFYGLTMGDHIPIYLYTVNDGKATITGCTDVVGDITIPSLLGGYEVVAIGDSAFATNILLTSVVIPNSVTSIGDYAFQSCTALTSLTIGNGVTTIGDRAFDSCTSLTSLTIPNGVTSIGDSAFLYCTALPAITVDPDNVNYANNAGDGVLYNKAITTLIQYPKGNVQTSFTVPDSVTTIGQSAFYYCFSLTSVTIGNSVTTIGQSAFYYCISLTSMIFLGHDVPTSVGTNWILGTPVGMVGHAYSTSNFPTPGNVFPEGQSRGDNGLLMSPGIVTHCVIDIVGDQIAGVGWSGTATAYDEFDNVVTTDSATAVTMTSTGAATFYTSGTYETPGNTFTLSSGVATFFVKDHTAQTITLTATVNEENIGTIADILVGPATIDHYHVSSSTPQTAGLGWSDMATAHDAFHNVVTTDSATVVTMTSTGDSTFYTDGDYDVLGNTYTLSSGIATYYVKDNTAQTITLTATSAGSKTGTSSNIVVNPASIDHYHVASSTPYTAGSGWSGTATAQDAFHNVVTTDSVTVVTMTATGAATFYTDGDYDVLGNTYALSSGVATYFVKDNIAQTITLTATDETDKTGNIVDILVNPAAIDHYHLASASPQTAGVGWSGTATAHDVFHNVVTTDSTTEVTITSNGDATFYSNGDYDVETTTYTLSAGVATFFVKDTTAQTITLTATSVESKTGSIANIVINPAAIDHYHVASLTPQTAGAGWSGTATAHDIFDNVVTPDSVTVVTMTGTGDATFYTSGTYETPGTTFTLSSGVATFFVKDTTAQTITLTATSVESKTGVSGNIVVNPAAIDHYHVASTTPQTAGAGWSGTATAHDAFHNVVTTDSTIEVTMTSTGEATFYTSGTYETPGTTFTLSSGVATFFVKDTTAQTITLTATSSGFKTGTSGNIVVNPAAIDHYHITSTTPQTAGIGWSGTATTHDIFDNVVTTDSVTVVTMTGTGDATFYSNGDYDVHGNAYTLSSGIANFFVKDTTAQTITMTANDPAERTGSIADILVNPAAIDHYHVASSTPQTAGAGWSGTATAHDAFHNVVTTDSTTEVTMTSTGAATFYTSGTYETPDNTYTMTAGVVTYFVKDTTAQTITLTATSAGSKTGSTANIVVNPASIDHFTVAGISDPVVAGLLTSPAITARDAYDNVKTDYVGTIHFTSTDVKGTTVLPGDYTFLLADAGVKTFTEGVKLTTTGDQSVTVTSTVGSETGSQTAITVNPAALDHFDVTVGGEPLTKVAGALWSTDANDVLVTAHDEFNNVVTGYTGSPVWSSSCDGTFPEAEVFELGTYTFIGTGFALEESGEQTITMTDGSITGTSATIEIIPAALDHFTVAGVPASCIAGTSWAGGSGIVTAYDLYDNVKTDYTGQVYFTSTDGAATLPYTSGSRYTFTAGEGNDNGVHEFSGAGFTLFTTGSRTITITTGMISWASASITVIPAVLDHFTVTGITDPVVAGVLTSPTVTAYDAYDNVKTDYVGTIHFTSTDVKASTVLPADYTFLLADEGMKTFADVIKLTTTGQQSVTVTSTVGSETGSQTAITVTLAALDHYQAYSTTPQVAGVGWYGTATAHDVFHNVVTTDSTTVVTMSSNGAATFYTDGTYDTSDNTYTMTAGVATFYVKDTTAQTITLTAISAGAAPGVATGIVVRPAAIDHFDVAVGGTLSFVAGAPWATTANDVVVTAHDEFSNVVTSYTGSPEWSASSAGTLPSPQAFVAGTFTFTGTGFALNTEGAQTITMTDGSITGSSANIAVTHNVAVNLVLTPGGVTVVAGTSQSYIATATDAFGNSWNVTGTTIFEIDLHAAGSWTDDVYLSHSAGMAWVINGTDSVSGIKATTTLTVTPATIHHFTVIGIPDPLIAGTPTTPVVTAYDAYGNIKTDYTGAIHFTSDDEMGGTILPGDYTFIVSDEGIKIFSDGVTIISSGEKYVKVQDTVTIAATGQQSAITVYAIPDAPTGFTAIADNGQITLNWTAPLFDGGSAIDYYCVYQNGEALLDTPTGLSTVITGLTNGGSYSFTVSAHNIAGYGPNSTSATAVPRTVADAPTDLVATPGNGQVSLSWTAPAFDGGRTIDYYVVYQNGIALPGHPSSLTTTIVGLTNGQVYSFAVTAYNIAGEGAPSSSIASTPYTVPNVLTGLSAIPGNAQVILNWTASAFDGGRIVDYYVVYQDGVALPDHVTGSSTIITGLTNGQYYTFMVAAHNIAGIGELSDPSNVIPFTVPDTPILNTVTAGVANVTLVWTAPASDGSSPITGYEIFFRTNDTDAAWTLFSNVGVAASSETVTGLTAGATYHFGVKAVNAAGSSVMSGSLNATVLTVPDAPTNLTNVASSSQVTISWNAPDGLVAGYLVHRGSSAADAILIGNSTIASFVDTAVTAGSIYYYKVIAWNVVGEGAMSEIVSVQVPFPALVPVSGMILDASGNGLAGVTVSLENGSSVLTDAQGNFLIMASQGNHTLTVSGDGIETSRTEFNVGGSSLVLNSITPVKAADSLPLALAVTIITIGLMLALIIVVRRGKGKK